MVCVVFCDFLVEVSFVCCDVYQLCVGQICFVEVMCSLGDLFLCYEGGDVFVYFGSDYLYLSVFVEEVLELFCCDCIVVYQQNILFFEVDFEYYGYWIFFVFNFIFLFIMVMVYIWSVVVFLFCVLMQILVCRLNICLCMGEVSVGMLFWFFMMFCDIMWVLLYGLRLEMVCIELLVSRNSVIWMVLNSVVLLCFILRLFRVYICICVVVLRVIGVFLVWCW